MASFSTPIAHIIDLNMNEPDHDELNHLMRGLNEICTIY